MQKANNISTIYSPLKEASNTDNQEGLYKEYEAIRTLLRFIGEDPTREGLAETPKRVIKAYKELFSGYSQDPKKLLAKCFSETADYNGPISIDKILFVSHCEHHLAPFFGEVNITYVPYKKIVGLSKFARLVDIFAKRLQMQERLTAEIAFTIFEVLQPKAVRVEVLASHACLNFRGACKPGSQMRTIQILGDKALLG